MAKIYERVNWENLPSKSTPVSAENLNKMDEAINKLDDKIVELEENGGSGGSSGDYLEKENPVGTGSFSMNRKADSDIGLYSRTGGYNGTASGECSCADGYFCVANGDCSYASGDRTIASGDCQHVQGKFNVEDTEDKYVHIVGGGTSDEDRKNIHTLDWEGNAEFAGDVTNGNGVSLSNLGELENLSTNFKENLVGAINEVFQSVSDGKIKIASAITDKSIVTPSDATFDIMADNIRNISTGEYKYISVREIVSLYLNGYDNTGDAYKTSLTIDGSNNWHYRGILQHDISMLPKGSTIISAKLLMYAFTGNDNYKDSRCYVSRVTSPWDDTTIWSTQPTYEEYVNHKQTPNVDVASGVPMWCEVDITDIVKQWVENDEINYGVMIRAIKEGGYRNNWEVYTRHYNNGEYASYINVVYIVN